MINRIFSRLCCVFPNKALLPQISACLSYPDNVTWLLLLSPRYTCYEQHTTCRAKSIVLHKQIVSLIHIFVAPHQTPGRILVVMCDLHETQSFFQKNAVSKTSTWRFISILHIRLLTKVKS